MGDPVFTLLSLPSIMSSHCREPMDCRPYIGTTKFIVQVAFVRVVELNWRSHRKTKTTVSEHQKCSYIVAVSRALVYLRKNLSLDSKLS